MFKSYRSFIACATGWFIGALLLTVSSCKDDDPAMPPSLSLASDALVVNEAAGTAQVTVVCSKALPYNLVVTYTLRGTATEGTSASADYSVAGRTGRLEMPAGATSGTIVLTIHDDAVYEGDETIELELEDTDVDEVMLTEPDKITITLVDDDSKNHVSFSETTWQELERNVLLPIHLTLELPAAADITVSYSLTGTAVDSVAAVNNKPNKLRFDYAIRRGKTGEVVIRQGETQGTIYLRLFSDFLIEDADPNTDPWDDETIVLTITGATGGILAEPSNSQLTMHVQQEDGRVVLLTWPKPSGANEADMDLFVRSGKNITTWDRFLTSSAAESSSGTEFVFLPRSLEPMAYGFSYTYYAGTLNPLEFDVVFIDFVDGALEDEASVDEYTATYTAINKNEWTDINTTEVVQTMTKAANGGDFDVPSTITVPTTGSRLPAPAASNVTKKDFSKMHSTEVANRLRHR